MTGPSTIPSSAVPIGPSPATITVPLVIGVPDPDALAALVLACPAVAGLSGGPLGSAATYLPGRRVSGIRIGDDTVEVHPVLAYGETVSELVRQVRRAVTSHVGVRSVDIVVEDVHVPGEDLTPHTPAEPVQPAPVTLPGQVLDPETPAGASTAADRLADDHTATPLLPGSLSASGRTTPPAG